MGHDVTMALSLVNLFNILKTDANLIKNNVFLDQFVFIHTCIYRIPPASCIDLKVQLQATDYGNFLQNEPSPIPVSVIDEKLRNHLVVEFQHMRNQSVEPLSNFLDYITSVSLSLSLSLCVHVCINVDSSVSIVPGVFSCVA